MAYLHLNKLPIFILALTALTFLASCDNFERRFYENIDQGQLNAFKTEPTLLTLQRLQILNRTASY
jgi:hypothetical protein